MNHSLPPARSGAARLGAALLLGLLVSTAPLPAQTAAAAATPSDKSEVLVLNPFEVSTARNEGYISKYSTASGRLAQKLEDVPQMITVVNSKFIEDISPGFQLDALRYVTGVSYQNIDRFATGGAINVRGFLASQILRNGQTTSPITGIGVTEAIEQWEVVKGASAVLYGASQAGGTINYVTKSPQFTPSYKITGSTYFSGRNGGYTGMLDATGPLGLKDKSGAPTLAYRLVVVNEDRDDFRGPFDFTKRDGVFGKLTWRPLPGLTIQTEYEFSKYRIAGQNNLNLSLDDVGKAARDVRLPDQFGIPVDWTFRDLNTATYGTDEFWQTSIVYTKNLNRFGVWSARAFFSWNAHEDYRIAGPTGGARSRKVTAADIGKVVNYTQAVTQADVDSGRQWIPNRGKDWQHILSPSRLNSQWDLTGKFDTGPLKHELMLGTELFLGQKYRYGLGQADVDFRSYLGSTSAHAIWVDAPDYRPIPVDWNDIRTAANPAGTIAQDYRGSAILTTTNKLPGYHFDVPFLTEKPTAYYVFDNITLLNDRVIASLGARHDDLLQSFNGSFVTSSNWTYRFGLVGKITPQLSVFGLYNESFIANPDAAAAYFNRFIPPQQGEQKEVGLRLSLWDGRVAINTSYFNIESSNVVQANPGFAGGLPLPPYTLIDGVKNKGVDFDATVNLRAGLQVILGYAWQDASAAPTPAQVAANPAIKRVRLNNVAETTFSFFGRWEPAAGILKGAWFTAGFRLASERPGGTTGSLAQVWLPTNHIWDAGVGYRWKNWSAGVTIQNLFNEYSYRAAPADTFVVPERPRTGVFKLTYAF